MSPEFSLCGLTGATLVERLLPHRAPLLLVDALTGFLATPFARAEATFLVCPTHPVLVGHFPRQPIWPGVYTIEGLAQTCLLTALVGRAVADGRVPEAGASLGISGALVEVDVKLTHAVVPGDRLDYEATLRHVIGRFVRFEVTASVGARTVAVGTMTGVSSLDGAGR